MIPLDFRRSLGVSSYDSCEEPWSRIDLTVSSGLTKDYYMSFSPIVASDTDRCSVPGPNVWVNSLPPLRILELAAL